MHVCDAGETQAAAETSVKTAPVEREFSDDCQHQLLFYTVLKTHWFHRSFISLITGFLHDCCYGLGC